MFPEAYGPFAKPVMTVSEAAAAGFTHIEARCSCGQITATPFTMLRQDHGVRDDTPLPAIARRMRCRRCGARPERWRPWHQYLDGALGYAYGDHRPPTPESE